MKTISIILLLTLAVSSLQAQRIKGSDTVLPVAQQTAERFMALNPDARVTVTGGGTGVGISALLDNWKISSEVRLRIGSKWVEMTVKSWCTLAKHLRVLMNSSKKVFSKIKIT